MSNFPNAKKRKRLQLLALLLSVSAILTLTLLFTRGGGSSDLSWNWDVRTWEISRRFGGSPEYKVTWTTFGPVTLRTWSKWRPGDDRSLLDQ